MSVCSSNDALSQLLPLSSDEEHISSLRRSTRRRRTSCWLEPQPSDHLHTSKTKQKSSSEIRHSSDEIRGVGSIHPDDADIIHSPALSSCKKIRRGLPLHSSPMDLLGSLVLRETQSVSTDISSLSIGKSSNSIILDEDDQEVVAIPVESTKIGESLNVDHTSETDSDSRISGNTPSRNEALTIRRSSRRRSLAVHNGTMLLSASCTDFKNASNAGSLDINIQSSSKPCMIDERDNICLEEFKPDLNCSESLSMNSSPVSIAGSMPSSPDAFISSEMIISIMKRYFGNSQYLTKPYVTPRLFASVLCVFEQEEGTSLDEIDPVIRLFKAYVQAEEASSTDLCIGSSSLAAIKKTHFCGYDMSAVLTPIDTVEDSNLILEKCIDSLVSVLQLIDTLRNSEDSKYQISWLTKATIILRNIQEMDDRKIAITCAKTMPFNWPSDRFKKASKLFQSEFTVISGFKHNDATQSDPSSLYVRRSLGDFLGRAIKYYLRRFFNPVPVPLYSDKDKLPDYSNSRSKIHSMIELKDCEGEGQRDTATADGCISSVFGLALKKYHDFFKLNQKLRCADEPYFTAFCSRAATKRGLKENDRLIQLSSDDTQAVQTDIQESHVFLAGIRALRFIHSLLTWPGVDDAIREVGGWVKVEEFASLFETLKLACDVPEESHLVQLRDVNFLLSSYENDKNRLEELESSLLANLREVWKRFKCGSRNPELFRLNPSIKLFQAVLKEGKNTQFPIISRVC